MDPELLKLLPSMESASTIRMRNATAPPQEYLMQGSILDTSCEVLLHRLRGLCDNPDDPTETFQDYELVFNLRGPTGTPLILRARHSLDHPTMPWHLRYTGHTDAGDKNRPTIVRTCIDVDTSNNVVQFLNELGFRVDFEYVLKGFMFRKGRVKIIVSKICRMLQQQVPETIEPVSQSYLVEMSIVAPAGQDSVAEELKAFADQLKPLVNLEKIDYRRLQHL